MTLSTLMRGAVEALSEANYLLDAASLRDNPEVLLALARRRASTLYLFITSTTRVVSRTE